MSEPRPSQATVDLMEVIDRHRRDPSRPHRVTQDEIADLIGASQGQVSRFFAGKRHVTVDQLYAVCRRLDLDLVEMIVEAERVREAKRIAHREATAKRARERKRKPPESETG